jgi:hypothetical protein
MSKRIDTLTERVAAVGDLVDDLLLTVAAMPGVDVETDPRLRTDDRLRELLTGLERLKNAAEAAQAEVMVALGDEARELDAAEFAASGLPVRSHLEFVPDEVGLLLTMTKRASSKRYGLALQAADERSLMCAWSAGELDARKVQVICDELNVLRDPELTFDVNDRELRELTDALTQAAVEYARTHTWTEVRAWLRRRVLVVAPDAAELRRGRAERERTVHFTPAEDGMTELWALLPSIEARQIQQALTSAAHDLGATDGRTMDQRRADLLVAWLLGPDHAPTVHLHVVAETTGAPDGERDVAAWLPGVGPLTELQTADLIGGATAVLVDGGARRLAVEGYRPSAGLAREVRTRDVTCRFPGCRRSALEVGGGTDLDHTVPWPAGATAAANLAALCRRHHRLKHSPGWSVVLDVDGAMTWTGPSGRSFTSEPWHAMGAASRASPPSDPPVPPSRE